MAQDGIYGLEDIFLFGKHKGQQVEDVIVDDPGWVRWVVENDIAEFDEETLERITKEGIL